MAGLFDKANDFLKSDQGEQASDAALDKASDLASSTTGDKYDEQIAQAREAADQHVGDE